MKPGVIISFDVECSMGGAWHSTSLKPVSPKLGMMGRYGDKYFGVPLLCKILNKNDLKGTFFVEPFNAELGYSGETAKVCDFLMEKGQDIQLHVHPNHYHYGLFRQGRSYRFTDQITELEEQEQEFLLNEGCRRIETWTGKRPEAFRAGNLGASEETLKILPKAGLWMDSSYSFHFAGGQCFFSPEHEFNGSKWYGDVLEVALSGFKQPPFPLLKQSKPLDLMGISFEECRDAVEMICASGSDAVIILHSFSLFKVKDKQYNHGRLNTIVKRRFEKFCNWLSNNRDKYPCRTFNELGEIIKTQGYNPSYSSPLTLNKPFRGAVRKAVQFINNFYWV